MIVGVCLLVIDIPTIWLEFKNKHYYHLPRQRKEYVRISKQKTKVFMKVFIKLIGPLPIGYFMVGRATMVALTCFY